MGEFIFAENTLKFLVIREDEDEDNMCFIAQNSVMLREDFYSSQELDSRTILFFCLPAFNRLQRMISFGLQRRDIGAHVRKKHGVTCRKF